MKGTGRIIQALLTIVSVSLLLGSVYADVGPGVLDDVQVCPSHASAPLDGNGMFVVTPGGSYRVVLTDVQAGLPNTIDVWIAGKDQNGDPWQIQTSASNGGSGTTYTSQCFTIPSNAGCTTTVHYYQERYVAAAASGSSNAGHMKTYYDNQPPFDNAIPCEPISVPEFSTGAFSQLILGFVPDSVPEFLPGAEALVALGILAAYAILRKKRQPAQ